MPSDASPQEKIENPWLAAFLSAPWEEIAIGQVVIRRAGGGFELRHADDAAAGDLRPIQPGDARAIANYNAAGEFRPLKSTRDLKRGWVLRAQTPGQLDEALRHLYPNALADRFALNQSPPPITGFREFAARQSGMYRITTFLADDGVADVIARTCSAICLKQRLWSVPSVPPDPPEAKSAIPCLEPCAVFLEATRKEVRARQGDSRKD